MLHAYIHNKWKISLFHVQDNMYTSPTKTSKLTHSRLHMSGQSLIYYKPVMGLMGLALIRRDRTAS